MQFHAAGKKSLNYSKKNNELAIVRTSAAIELSHKRAKFVIFMLAIRNGFT